MGDRLCRCLRLVVALYLIHLLAVCIPELNQTVYPCSGLSGLSWPLVYGHQIEEVAGVKSELARTRPD
jgi:hypothetical protein